jgi:hypothetical protein
VIPENPERREALYNKRNLPKAGFGISRNDSAFPARYPFFSDSQPHPSLFSFRAGGFFDLSAQKYYVLMHWDSD